MENGGVFICWTVKNIVRLIIYYQDGFTVLWYDKNVTDIKKLDIIIPVAMIAITALVALAFFHSPQSPIESMPADNTVFDFAAPQVWDDLHIAGNILEWLENDAKDGRGVYKAALNCKQGENGVETCDSGFSNNTGMAVIWTNYVYWQRTGDLAALERMKTALTTYANRDVVETILTDNLSCYYLLPIILDDNPAISGTDRMQAMLTCFETEYENAMSENIIAPPLAFLLEEVSYKANLIMGLDESVNAESNIFPYQTQGKGLILPSRNWADLATEFIIRYQLDPQEYRLDLAQAYYLGVLDVYIREPKLDNPLTCPLLLASQAFCDTGGEIGDIACDLVIFLGNKAINETYRGETFIGIENYAKCALALPPISDYFIEYMRIYYYSQANANGQYTEPWLLNSYPGQTKNVVDNALFAGMLIR